MPKQVVPLTRPTMTAPATRSMRGRQAFSSVARNAFTIACHSDTRPIHLRLRQWHERPSLARENCQICFGSTDVASNEHWRSPFFG